MERPRVVLADDHRAILDVVANLLAPRFDVVGMAGDGLEALRLLTALRPDAVVLDLAMPGLDGLALTARVRQIDSPPAIVMLTISADPALVEAALAGGALGYVIKARAAADLIPAIEAALEGRRFVSAPLSRSA